MHAVLPRLVLAFVFAVPLFLVFVAPSVDSAPMFTLVVRMSSSTAGVMDVLPDVGGGYQGGMSVGTVASAEARDYRLPLAAGSYLSLRIDPGNAVGLYTIESVRVLAPDGREYLSIPLGDLRAAYHLTIAERTADKVVFECPPGSYDPQIIYAPNSPLWLLPDTPALDVLARRFGLYVAIAFAVIWVAQLALGGAAPAVSRALLAIGRGAAAHPHVALLVTAFVATVIAMHPVLFFGRSLVSPANGGVPLLYDQSPFTPGLSDISIEDVRTSDVGATMWAFVPYSMIQRQALASGEWPLWNRHNGPGVSLWGQGQSFLLDPLHWLTLIGPDPAPGWDLKFAAHRMTLAWGVGVAALAVTGAWVPAAIAASSAPFAGIFAFRLNHPATFALTYAPWVLAGWFLLARATTDRQRFRSGALIALASALVLFAAPPKEAVTTLFVVEMTGLLALLLQVGLGRHTLRPLFVSAVAALAAVLLTMPHWLVFFQTLSASKTHYDVPSVMFATRAFTRGIMLGTLTEGQAYPSLHALSLVLVLAALLAPVRLARDRAGLACGLGAASALAVAYGAIPGPWLMQVPLVRNIVSIHANFVTAALVPLLVLSAVGAAALLEVSHARMVMLAVLAVASWLFNEAGGVAGLARFPAWLVLGVMSAALLVPWAMRAAAREFPRVLPVIAFVALIFLLLVPGGQHFETGIPALDRVLVQPRLRAPLGVTSPNLDAIHATGAEPARTIGVSNLLMAGTQPMYRLEGIGGPDAVFLRTTDELMASANVIRRGWRFIFDTATLDRSAPLLDMLNVGFVLARYDDLSPVLGPAGPIETADPLRLVVRRTAWPRAYFVDRVGTYAAPPELLAQARAAGGPIASILSSDTRAAEIARSVASGPGEVVRADRYTLTTNTTTFHVRAPHAGVAVLAESYMPDDFIATLNGQAVPYFRVNHAFKGVTIPGAGDWEVRFQYRPHRWSLALAAAAVGGLMLMGLAGVGLGLSSTLSDP